MCPHDNVTITCTTYTGELTWINPNDLSVLPATYNVFSTNLPYPLGIFTITDASSNEDMRSSTVTLNNIMVIRNNTGIECLDGSFGNANTKTANISIIITGT